VVCASNPCRALLLLVHVLVRSSSYSRSSTLLVPDSAADLVQSAHRLRSHHIFHPRRQHFPLLFLFNQCQNCQKKLSSSSLLHDSTLRIALLGLASLLTLLDLRDHALESLADVLVVARAGLCEAAAQLFGELLAVCEGDLALLGSQVGFVAHDRERDCVGALCVVVS
jgi:hypothetical protein